MHAAVWEEFGTKSEQAEAEETLEAALAALGWAPPSAEDLLRFARAPENAPANEHGRPFPAAPAARLRLDAKLMTRLVAGADWLMVAAVAQLAALWGYGLNLIDLPLGQAIVIALAALCLKGGLWITGAYDTPPAKMGPETALGGLALGAVAGIFVSGLAATDARGAAALAATLPLVAIALAGIHAGFSVLVRALWARGAFAETAVVIGATVAAERFVARAKATGDVRVLAVVDDRGERAPARIGSVPVVGGAADLLQWEALPHVDRIVICIHPNAETRVRALISQLRAAPNRVDLLFDYEVNETRGRKLTHAAGAPLALVSGKPRSAAWGSLKRAQDVLIGGALALVFAPVMAIIACAVRLDSPGPVFFKQRRHGLNNRVITIWKFRTMRRETCFGPTEQVRAGDPRVTRLGRFLRRTSLDELPQLLNVLRGEMSLVGPRPHAVDMKAGARALTDIVTDYAHRHRVKPGLTGWAQINGSRGPIETPEAVRRRIQLDLDYVAKSSLWLDLWILLRTAPALLGDRKATR